MERLKYADIKRLVQLVESSDISELEIVEEGSTLRIKKEKVQSVVSVPIAQGQVQPQFIQASAPSAAPAPDRPLSAAPAVESKPANLTDVKSPMVGTFYRAPSPEAEPYVQVGSKVKPGQVLCIVEAMKLMNEIECETNGIVTEVCVENGKPVEFNQTLFRIKPE